MSNLEPAKPIETWKIIVGLITLGIFAFIGYVASYPDKLGIVIGIVLWVVAAGWFWFAKDIRTVLEGQKRKIAREEEGSALEILEKRYALGEIDKEEYEEKRKALTSKKHEEEGRRQQ